MDVWLNNHFHCKDLESSSNWARQPFLNGCPSGSRYKFHFDDTMFGGLNNHFPIFANFASQFLQGQSPTTAVSASEIAEILPFEFGCDEVRGEENLCEKSVRRFFFTKNLKVSFIHFLP